MSDAPFPAAGSVRGARALVLGASGYIGRALCARLSGAGAMLRCFDRAAPASGPAGAGAPEWVVGEFSDSARLREALEGVDFVFHLISTTIPETSNRDLAGDLSSNVLPTLGLLEAASDAGVKRLVFVSSGGTVYGIPRSIPIPESHPTDPICGYGIHKLAIEKYLHLYRSVRGLDYRVLRLSNPYGPGQVSDRPQGVIGRFVYKALRGEPIEIWGDGSVVRDYLYLDDALDVFLLSLGYEGEQRIFNVGSGIGLSLLDVVSAIGSQVGRPPEVRYLPGRQVDVPSNVLDITRARLEMGWSPRTDIGAGIRAMVESARLMGLA